MSDAINVTGKGPVAFDGASVPSTQTHAVSAARSAKEVASLKTGALPPQAINPQAAPEAALNGEQAAPSAALSGSALPAQPDGAEMPKAKKRTGRPSAKSCTGQDTQASAKSRTGKDTQASALPALAESPLKSAAAEGRPSAPKRTASRTAKGTERALKTAGKDFYAAAAPSYRPEFCQRLLAFFDVAPFTVTEVQKKDGSITLVESASELPTFAAFARTLGVTQHILQQWEDKHPAFAEAAKKARDLQGNILIQNSLRGNYSASFAVFTAKNLLGWSDGKEETKKPLGTVIVHWEKE